MEQTNINNRLDDDQIDEKALRNLKLLRNDFLKTQKNQLQLNEKLDNLILKMDSKYKVKVNEQ